MKNTLFIPLILSIFFTGCAHLTVSNEGLSNKIQSNPIEGRNYQLRKNFEVKKWNHYYLFSLIPEERKMQELLAEHVQPGEVVADLKIEKKTTFVNGLICALIGIVYCPDMLVVTGNVYEQPVVTSQPAQ